MRRRYLVVAGVLLLIVIAGAASAYYVTRHRFGGNVIGSTSGFDTTQVTPPPRPRVIKTLPSPMFGVGPDHSHVAVGQLRPPFHLDWVANGRSLIEFPPALAYDRLYYANVAGKLRALSTSDGKWAWTVRVNRCEAAGPAVSTAKGGTVYETFLNHQLVGHKCAADPTDGLVLAVSAGKHGVRWQRNLGASETSPTVVGKRVYIGTAAGYVYCLDAESGHVLWRYSAGGAVKGAIAYDRGKVFFGAYNGNLYALTAGTGRQVWIGSSFGGWGGRGHFYSTPAVAYNRVYIGSTDGHVYAFDERTGHVAWAHATGSYVYGSPAVYGGRVFVGSYDRVFYALSAATGNPDWTFTAAGPISGSATVVDGVVYFAHLVRPGEPRHTYALDARTGRQLWSFHDGSFTPVVADRTRLYLVGWGRIYAFSPLRHGHGVHLRRHRR